MTSPPPDFPTVWLAGFLVVGIAVQAGLGCLACGLTRSKHRADAAFKTAMDFCLAGSLLWLYGYMWIVGSASPGSPISVGGNGPPDAAAVLPFLVLLVCCAAATSIGSTAALGRLPFPRCLVLSAIAAGIVFPSINAWTWPGSHPGWLARWGFHDFAGATTVFAAGGWVALAAMVAWPRSAAVSLGPPATRRVGHLPAAVLGGHLFALGWIGVACGRAVLAEAPVPTVLLNLVLASLAAGATAVVAGPMTGALRVSADTVLSSALAGLVAVCAGCDIFQQHQAILVALVAALAVQAVQRPLRCRWENEATLGLLTAPLVAGVWGTLAVGLLAPPQALHPGATRLGLLAVQTAGVVVCGVWSLGLSWWLLRMISHHVSLEPAAPEPVSRTEAVEMFPEEPTAVGNLHELLQTMHRNAQGDFSRRAQCDASTIAGLIARYYNRVLDARQQIEQELRHQSGQLQQSHRQIKQQALALQAQASQLREAQQKAEQASIAKSAFIANISHEIRTPMTAILGYVDLLRRSASAADLTPERRQALDIIQRNGEHLLQLINDLLDISRMEAGQVSLERAPFSPAEVINDVAQTLRERAAEKGLRLHVDYATPLPAQIISDPMRLRQVLVNLLGNAVTFTHQGEVRLAVEYLAEPLGPLFRLAIRDTGIGMTREQIERAFEPFSQADASTTRRHGGTGLGLAICARLVRAMGGTLEVDSKPDEGTVCQFTFVPQIDPQVEMLWPEQALRCGSRRPAFDSGSDRPLQAHILLAEDGVENQRLIKLILERAGADVEVADNGRIALEAYQQSRRPFDLVLMDMQMPELDGYGAARQLRDLGYTAPILALTAHAQRGDREKCLQAGCSGYLTKPIQHAQLVEAIREALAGASAAAAELNSAAIAATAP